MTVSGVLGEIRSFVVRVQTLSQGFGNVSRNSLCGSPPFEWSRAITHTQEKRGKRKGEGEREKGRREERDEEETWLHDNYQCLN